MSHTEVPSLGDDPDAILAIGDGPNASFPFDDDPWSPIDESVRPPPRITSNRFVKTIYHSLVPGPGSQFSDYDSNSIAGRSEDSRGSKDSGYESASSFRELGYGGPHSGPADIRSYYPASIGRLLKLSDLDLVGTYQSLREPSDTGSASSVRAVQGKETQKTDKPILHCRYEPYEYITKRQYDLDRHQAAHVPPWRRAEKYDCTGRGCGRTGAYGFSRRDHLREHLKRVHAKDIPKMNRRSDRGLERLGDVGSYNADSKAPGELKAQDESNIEVSKPIGLPESPLVKLPKSTILLGNPSNVERLESISSQTPYVAERGRGTASGIKYSIGHDMDGDEKESPSSTCRKSCGYVHLASDPESTHVRSKSQSVKLEYEDSGLNPNNIERRPSTIFADVERSTMTIAGERGVQDTVDPRKIMLEPDKEARASLLDHSVHTLPLTLIDKNHGLLSSLSDDSSEHLQDGDDVSLVDEHSWSNLNPLEHPANATMVEDGAETGFSGEPIEPVEDFQPPSEAGRTFKSCYGFRRAKHSERFDESGEKNEWQVGPVNPTENIIMVEDAAQMNTLGNLVEAVDDQSSHMAHDTHTSNKLVHMAPQHDAYMMTLLSLRIELRIWHGRHAPFPTIHVSTGGEELLEDGKQRIRWTCRCGHRLYDDFEEHRPVPLGEMEQMLNEQNRVCSPEGNGSGQHSSSLIHALWNAASGIISSLTGSRPSKITNLSTLPLHQPHAVDQERKSESSALSENLFLLLCIPYRKHGTRLVNMDLADLDSDVTLFRTLKRGYQSIRGRWASYFSLWKMAEIQFVKFGLHKHQLVDIKEKNDLPPVTLKNEYRYQPIPAETIPPIGKNHLIHLYEHPDHADDIPFCLERIPKKLRDQLRLCQHQAPGLVGWGVCFAEGYDWPKFWIFGSVVLSLSVLFGVCWSTLRQDVQGGFGVTTCMMVAVTFTTGVVQAAVGQT